MKVLTRYDLETSDPIYAESSRDRDTYRRWQSLYMNLDTGQLIPNVEVWVGGQLWLKVNSLGCRGPELQPDKPLILVLGDSGVFGLPGQGGSWVNHLKVPGYQVLNGGGEGYSLPMVVDNFLRLRKLVNPDVVVISSGWHNIIYNERTEDFWTKMYDQFAGQHALAICSLACALTEECRTRGISELIAGAHEPDPTNPQFKFNFWSTIEPTLENVIDVLDNVERHRNFIQSYCQQRGLIFIDHRAYMTPRSYLEIPVNFFDIAHSRPSGYAMMGRYTSNVLSGRVAPRSEQSAEPATSLTQAFLHRLIGKDPAPDESSVKKEVQPPAIYPLW